jgi:hypothetical protein
MRLYSSDSDYNYFLEQLQRFERIRNMRLESCDADDDKDRVNKYFDDSIDREFRFLRRCAKPSKNASV